MNLNQLRFVHAVAKTSSFSRAAESCHVTQPALSNSIAQLEAEFGAPLFERTTRQVRLSPFGRHMMPLIEQAMDAVNDLASSAEAFLNPAVKMARIGLSPIVDMARVARALESYSRANPDVEIFFKQCYLDDLEQRLLDGHIDIGLWPAPERTADRLVEAPVYTEPLMLIPRAGSGSDPIPKGPVRIGEIAEETLVLTPDVCGLVRAVRRLFREAGAELIQYPGQALSYEVMQVWADLGIGTAILPASKLQPGAADRARPLCDNDRRPARLKLVASWKETMRTPPHIQTLRQHVAEIVPKLLSGELSSEGV